MTVAATQAIQVDIEASFKDLLSTSGALVVGLGNCNTGQCFAYDGIDSPAFPNYKVPMAVEGNAEVVRAKQKVAGKLQFKDNVDQIMISLTTQWHLIKLLSADGYFIYLALDRSKSNIASATFKLIQADDLLSPKLAKA